MANRQFEQFTENLGKNIAFFRKMAGLSQEQLAERVGMDRVSIGYIEQCRRTPKLRSLFLIAQAINQPICTLISTERPHSSQR